MSGCTGPCNQGRLPCPTPDACGLEEPPKQTFRVVLFDVVVAVFVLAVLAMILLGVVR